MLTITPQTPVCTHVCMHTHTHIYIYIYIYTYLFTNLSARTGCNTMSTFQQSLTCLNRVFLLLDWLPKQGWRTWSALYIHICINTNKICIYTYMYRSYGSQTWLIKWNAVSSKQRSCQYCYMDALHGRWLNGWRKSLTATTQECCEQFWTSPGGNTPQSNRWTATYLPSRKLSKLDEPDMQNTAGEAGTGS